MSSVRVLGGNKTTSSSESPLDSLLQKPAFSADAWHAMNARDNMQVEQEVLNGDAGAEYVYAMLVQGKLVTGVSVVGASQLACEYGGIKSRLIGSTHKKGSLFVFWRAGQLDVRSIPELEDQPDYYEAVVEVTDIKTGNSIEIRKTEEAFGTRRDGGKFARPHFDTIAESKARRKGTLSLIPQSIVSKFKLRCLDAAIKAGAFDDPKDAPLKTAIKRFLATLKVSNAGPERTIDQLRSGAMEWAAKNAISLDRMALQNLTYDEIYGLGGAARDGKEAFRVACEALGVLRDMAEIETNVAPPEQKQEQEQEKKKETAGRKQKEAVPSTEAIDKSTGEITEPIADDAAQATEAMIGDMEERALMAAITQTEIQKQFGLNSLEGLTIGQYKAICEWLNNPF